MNMRNKKLIAAIILMAFVVIGLPHFAKAQAGPGPSFLSCVTSPFSCTVFGISVLINSFLGLFVSLGSWFVQLGLQFNQSVINSPAVKAGFGVSLAIANLGFVLAIIVIALATILRSQTYGVKQLLWKLVVAAIIVNFSLVIAGAVLGFADSFTNFFITAISPTANSEGVINTTADYLNFTTRLTTAFAPQRFFQPPASAVSAIGSFFSVSQFSNFISMVLSMAISAIMLLIIVFTLLAIAVMLFIRYAFIGILLILAPLAWLLWIFPTTSPNLSKWWHHFIRWSFFPTIMIFFLYLALQTAFDTGKYLDTFQFSPANSETATINEVTRNDPGLTQTIGKDILLIALVLGGLFAANSLSIVGASVAMGLAKSAGKGIQGFAAKQGKKLGGAAYRGAGGAGYREKLQKGELKGIGRIIPGRLQSLMGRGMSQLERGGGANLVENEKKWAAQFTDPKEMAALLAGSLPKEKQIALLKRMLDTEDLGEVKTVNGVDRDKFINDNEKAFKDYGQGKFYEKDIQRALANIKAAEAARVASVDPDKIIKDVGNVFGKGVEHEARAIDILNESMKQFARKQERSDASKIDLNHLFKTETLGDKAVKTRMKAYLRKIASQNHELVPGMLSQMKGEQKANFLTMYREAIESEEFDVSYQIPTNKEEIAEKTETLGRLKRADEAVERILSNLAAYAGGGRDGGAAGGGAAAATP